MKFIKQPESLKEITAMSLSPNKRFLAVCERHKNDTDAYLSFYDMKSNFKQIKQSINVCELITPFPTQANYTSAGAKDTQHGATSPQQQPEGGKLSQFQTQSTIQQ